MILTNYDTILLVIMLWEVYKITGLVISVYLQGKVLSWRESSIVENSIEKSSIALRRALLLCMGLHCFA